MSNSPSPFTPSSSILHPPSSLPLASHRTDQTSHEPIISFWVEDRHPHFPRESRAWMQRKDPRIPFPTNLGPVLESELHPHHTPPIISIVLLSSHKTSTIWGPRCGDVGCRDRDFEIVRFREDGVCLSCFVVLHVACGLAFVDDKERLNPDGSALGLTLPERNQPV